MTTQEAIHLIEESKDAERLLGTDSAARYRELARLVHPDLVRSKAPSMENRAKIAFQKLNSWFHIVQPGRVIPKTIVIKEWEISDLASATTGDIADVHHAANSRLNRTGILKIARSPTDNDLMLVESKALIALHSKLEPNWKKYLPDFIEDFKVDGRQTNVLGECEGIPLSQISGMVPEFDFRHIIWMGNRALSALGAIHKAGYIHGAPIPHHLLYGPINHQLKLVDWCYVQPTVEERGKSHIVALPTDYLHFYPSEVKNKNPPFFSTDIYVLMMSLKHATEADIPKRFDAIFDWALAASPRTRPSDAWVVLDRWLAAAEKEYGPPKYLKLDIPIS